MKKTIIILASLLLLAACKVDDSAFVPLVELGTPEESYLLEADGGKIDLQIFSNSDYTVKLDREASWLTLGATEGRGDGVLSVTAALNEGFRRMAGVVLCSELDTRRDTVLIKQKGMMETTLSIANTSIVGAGKGGTTEAPINTNIDFSEMQVVVNYLEDSDWITGVTIEGGNIKITTLPNEDPVKVRTAAIVLSFVDGWGEQFELQLNFSQKNANEILGELISLADLKSFYEDGVINEDILVEGIVVSNTPGGNAGENEQKTTSSIDYSGSKSTVYLEAYDGSCGVMLLTATPEDNIFNRYDHVTVRIKGTELEKNEEPTRFCVKGVASSMIVSQTAGSKSDVPVKLKAFKDLTDDDIFTYVTLKDVEFPLRKGAIMPINEGYSIASNVNRISKYPRLLRDKDGNSFYMYTNSVCLYRNDGTRLPYGSGNVSGVIVHERYSRFTWKQGADLLDIDMDLELGNIGRYQIRHQDKDDIWGEMNDSVEDSFSALLTEYRFWNPDPADSVMRPTYGTNGWFTHTYQKKYTGSDIKDFTFDVEDFRSGQHLQSEVCFSYLGPMGMNADYLFGLHPGNVNGLGIVLDPAKEHWNAEMDDWVAENKDGNPEWMEGSVTDEENKIRIANGGNMFGRTWCAADTYCTFRSQNWWDYDLGRGYAWMLNFSTEGVATDHLSLQISQLNTAQKFYAPRYWKAEWSEVDSMNPADDDKWHLIAEYTVPDISQWSNTLYSSIVGFKSMDFPLPLEMLGKPNVYIRLMPTSDVCSDGGDYADAVMGTETGSGYHDNTIEYIAIRYNK